MTFVIRLRIYAKSGRVGQGGELECNLRKSICILDIAAKAAICIIDNTLGFS